MDGKYVGSRPIKLRRSCWKDRNIDQVRYNLVYIRLIRFCFSKRIKLPLRIIAGRWKVS